MYIKQKHEADGLRVIKNNTTTRREFLKKSSAVALFPLLSVALPREAKAILPAVWAGAAAGAAAGAVARIVVSKTVIWLGKRFGKRRVAAEIKRRGVREGAQHGRRKAITAGVGTLANYSPEILAMAVEAGTEVIWAQSGSYNDLSVIIENTSERHVDIPMEIILKDTETGELEMSSQFIFSSGPLQSNTFDMQIIDLPNTGVKQVIGAVEHEDVIIHHSEKIVVAGASQMLTTN